MRDLTAVTRRAWAGLLGLAAAGCGTGTGGGAGRAVPAEYSVEIVNNTGDMIYRFGVDFGPRPQPLGERLGDGAYAGYGLFPYRLPGEAGVFWEAPEGVRHERRVAVLAHVPDTREKVSLFFLVRADGAVDVLALTDGMKRADRAAALRDLMRRGRPADKPEPPRSGD